MSLAAGNTEPQAPAPSSNAGLHPQKVSVRSRCQSLSMSFFATTGPGGERLVLHAGIRNDGHLPCTLPAYADGVRFDDAHGRDLRLAVGRMSFEPSIAAPPLGQQALRPGELAVLLLILHTTDSLAGGCDHPGVPGALTARLGAVVVQVALPADAVGRVCRAGGVQVLDLRTDA